MRVQVPPWAFVRDLSRRRQHPTTDANTASAAAQLGSGMAVAETIDQTPTLFDALPQFTSPVEPTGAQICAFKSTSTIPPNALPSAGCPLIRKKKLSGSAGEPTSVEASIRDVLPATSELLDRACEVDEDGKAPARGSSTNLKIARPPKSSKVVSVPIAEMIAVRSLIRSIETAMSARASFANTANNSKLMLTTYRFTTG